jgi:VIT1/CCC1 family predicted Fe2+/Mn2+ transporter
MTKARPIQAAVASAASFSIGAAPPAILAALLHSGSLTIYVVGMTLGLLLILGGLAAHLGGASLIRGALRVAFWGAVAMGCTAIIGHLFRGVV